MKKLFRIGCLNSETGRWHSDKVAALIKPSGYETEIHPAGDFEQLEIAIIDGSIELAVCRADELPVKFSDTLELIALTERQTVNDVVVSRTKGILSSGNKKAGVTSGLKLAFAKKYYPELQLFQEYDPAVCVESLNTKKVDALILDINEILPRQFDIFTFEPIETSYFVPAAGQGSLAVLCHKKLPYGQKEILQRWVNHEETEDCIRAERSFLKELSNTENMLPFGYAHFEGALITLKAGLIAPDGKEIFKTKKSASLGDSKDLGRKAALEIAKVVSEQRMHVI